MIASDIEDRGAPAQTTADYLRHLAAWMGAGDEIAASLREAADEMDEMAQAIWDSCGCIPNAYGYNKRPD